MPAANAGNSKHPKYQMLLRLSLRTLRQLSASIVAPCSSMVEDGAVVLARTLSSSLSSFATVRRTMLPVHVLLVLLMLLMLSMLLMHVLLVLLIWLILILIHVLLTLLILMR
jgi:hypothetical protein